MTWRKYFTPVDNSGLPLNINSGKTNNSQAFGAAQDDAWLPEIYQGSPNRILRYSQYDIMDQDPEINQALDTIAEFGTQNSEFSQLPFEVKHVEEPSDTESSLITESLRRWVALNSFEQRSFRLFRNTLKYGDTFMIRDPETYKLFWVDPAKVEKVVVNESEGKDIEYYYIKDIDPNFEQYIATDISPIHTRSAFDGIAGLNTARAYNSTGDLGTEGTHSGKPVKGSMVCHVSLTEGMDNNWPFGTSILDPIYKTYRQKELLEDSVIIYRLHRAPERRVFFLDVGNMPPHKAKQYLEQVKYEVKQKRIPNVNGAGNTVSDSIHNPMGMLEDFFFTQTSEGRGSRVDTLPGGDNLGDIDDLRYFNNKLLRGLRIPSSYLPTGPDDGTAVYNDGKVGVAYIQEYRFSKYVERLQRQIERSLDFEFKMYMKWCGVEIDNAAFKLKFSEPQNFSSFRDIQVNAERAALFGQLADVPFLSNKFKLQKYLGLTDDEMKQNEKMWRSENDEDEFGDTDQSGLQNMGVRPAPEINIDTNVDTGDNLDDVDTASDIDLGAGDNPGTDLPTI